MALPFLTDKRGGRGVGVFYQAEGLRLDHKLALKFLPSDFTIDEEAKKAIHTRS